MHLKLSERLSLVAKYVEPGSVVIDVGTDHAYVPIWLLQTGVSPRAFASDRKPGPLRRAKADAEKYGVQERLTLFLCDGLALCKPEDVDTVILAGMGGETIANILEKAPWAWEKHLILQPQSKLPELHRWLREQQLQLLDVALACDAGKIYPVWLSGRATAKDNQPSMEQILANKHDPLLQPWLETQIQRMQKQLHGMEQGTFTDIGKLRQLQAVLLETQALYQELFHCETDDPLRAHCYHKL